MNEMEGKDDIEGFIQDRLGQLCSMESLRTNYKDMVVDMCWNFENVGIIFVFYFRKIIFFNQKSLALKNALLGAYLDRSDSLPWLHPKSLFRQSREVFLKI